MNISEIYEHQLKIALTKFKDVIMSGAIVYSESGIPLKLRLDIVDGSIVDMFYSVRGKFAYHWERRTVDGTIYRHDNAPHTKWRHIRTFPKHFHDGSDDNAGESFISGNPPDYAHTIYNYS
jgi:hypothetical protein